MDEKELVQKCQQGDEKAFEELIKLTKDKIFFHCLHLVKDEEIAQDLTQETFLHAYRHIGDFRMEASFSTWIWRICHNLCLNYLKKSHPPEKSLKEEISPAIEEKKEDNELLKKIQEVLPLLPEKQRLIFEMYHLKRIPQKEIAVKLGIPHGTVRSRLYYAKKRLKEILRADLFE